MDATVGGAGKEAGTDCAPVHEGTCPEEVTVPGDGGNDSMTPVYAFHGAVTGNVRDLSKNAVHHAIDMADVDGAEKVSCYPGPTLRLAQLPHTTLSLLNTTWQNLVPPLSPTGQVCEAEGT